MRHTVAKMIITILLIGGAEQAMGQKWSISTNLLDYADFLTLNAEAGVSVHQHWSVSLKGRYNLSSYIQDGIMGEDCNGADTTQVAFFQKLLRKEMHSGLD